METRRFDSVRFTGIVIVALSVLSFIVILSITLPSATQGHLNCQFVSQSCTILGHFPLEAYTGLISTLIIMVFGTWIVLKSKKEVAAAVKKRTAMAETVRKLSDNEKKIYDHIVQHDGIIFQNEIIKDVGYSKVKTSRILDKLETKGLIERRRRGMANLIVLKRQ